MTVTKKLKAHFAWITLVIVGMVLGMAAIFLVVHDRQTEPKPPLGNVTSSSGPSSVKPGPETINHYSVPPTNPKYIAIPAINVERTRILQLNLTKDNQIATPDNIYDAGWYGASARPGQNGAMFIYGHVSSWTANGIFYNLKALKSGDEVIVTRGDDKVFTYQVVSIKTYPYDNVDMNAVLAPIDQSKPGLNLMTCTGQIIKGTSEFSERLVVFTRQLN